MNCSHHPAFVRDQRVATGWRPATGTRYRSAFTLIELMAVVLIIGIMLAVGIPAITSLTKSSALQSGTRHLSSTMSLARQYAITQRSNTRVVFPYSATNSTGTNLAPRYQSFAVLWSNRTTSAWEYINKWEHLPDGVVLTSTNSGALDSLSSDTLPYPTNSANNITLAYVQFTPTGASGASANSKVTLIEGFVDSATSTRATSSNYANVVVEQLLGRVSVERP